MKRYTSKLFYMALFFSAGCIHAKQGLKNDALDVMVDFGYPVSMMQSVRQNLNQSLYFLQQHNFEFVIPNLQEAVAKLDTRLNVSQDDKDYIQAMIDQINALIESLESEHDRSLIVQLCQQIQDHL